MLKNVCVGKSIVPKNPKCVYIINVNVDALTIRRNQTSVQTEMEQILTHKLTD